MRFHSFRDSKTNYRWWLSPFSGEFSWGSGLPMFGIALDFGSDTTFGLHLVWFHFFLSFDGLRRERDPREIGLKIHDGIIWIRPWTKQHEWNRSDPFWAKGLTIHPLDIFLGKSVYAKEVLEIRGGVPIPMPEKTYYGVATKDRSTWKRPRWPFARERTSVWIDIEGGVPAPGKWGEDGIFGTGGDDWEDAIGNVIAATLKMRKRHGTGYLDTGKRISA